MAQTTEVKLMPTHLSAANKAMKLGRKGWMDKNEGHEGRKKRKRCKTTAAAFLFPTPLPGRNHTICLRS